MRNPLRDISVVRGLAVPVLLRGAIASHSTSTVDETWDAGANLKRCPESSAALRSMHAWVDSDGDTDAKASYKLPHHEVSQDGSVGAANLHGVRNALARLPQSDIPTADHSAVQSHLNRHLDDGTESDSAGDVMVIRFSPFGTWYRIDSFWEGSFLERTQLGAFTKTIGEHWSRSAARASDGVKVLFNHGMEFDLGDKVLGVPEVLEERADSPYAEVPLFAGVPELIVSGLRAGAYGSSFMFRVIQDSWNDEPERSEHNPDGMPERTITEVRLMEFGPVTWPANPAATAGMRSGTDWYADKLRMRSPDRFEALSERFADFRAQHGIRTPQVEAASSGTSTTGAANSPTDAPDIENHATGLPTSKRLAAFARYERERRERELPFLVSGSRL